MLLSCLLVLSLANEINGTSCARSLWLSLPSSPLQAIVLDIFRNPAWRWRTGYWIYGRRHACIIHRLAKSSLPTSTPHSLPSIHAVNHSCDIPFVFRFFIKSWRLDGDFPLNWHTLSSSDTCHLGPAQYQYESYSMSTAKCRCFHLHRRHSHRPHIPYGKAYAVQDHVSIRVCLSAWLSVLFNIYRIWQKG